MAGARRPSFDRVAPGRDRLRGRRGLEEWARELCERVDRRGQRNAAVRAAAALLRQDNPSATAKTVESELRGYLSRAWPRERDFASPEPGCSALRQALWRVGKLTAGAGLGWRTILDLIEN